MLPTFCWYVESVMHYFTCTLRKTTSHGSDIMPRRIDFTWNVFPSSTARYYRPVVLPASVSSLENGSCTILFLPKHRARSRTDSNVVWIIHASQHREKGSPSPISSYLWHRNRDQASYRSGENFIRGKRSNKLACSQRKFSRYENYWFLKTVTDTRVSKECSMVAVWWCCFVYSSMYFVSVIVDKLQSFNIKTEYYLFIRGI